MGSEAIPVVPDPSNAVVFGGLGAIGHAVAEGLTAAGHKVFRTTRSCDHGEEELLPVDPFEPGGHGLEALARLPRLHAAVWAQGDNHQDSLATFELASFEAVLRANCTYVAATLAALVERDLLVRGARLCVVSSVWQLMARQNKLSYVVSKAAVGGLVRSAAVDLAARGVMVNAVMPGALDTPMARSMLSADQLAAIASSTGFDRLPTLDDVVGLVCFLCSDANTGVTGQSISVDLGYSVGRLV